MDPGMPHPWDAVLIYKHGDNWAWQEFREIDAKTQFCRDFLHSIYAFYLGLG